MCRVTPKFWESARIAEKRIFVLIYPFSKASTSYIFYAKSFLMIAGNLVYS